MRCYECPKNGADIAHGKVMMAIDATPAQMKEICRLMEAEHFFDTTCQEEADREGEVSCFWMMWRDKVKDFRETWTEIKKQVLQQKIK